MKNTKITGTCIRSLFTPKSTCDGDRSFVRNEIGKRMKGKISNLLNGFEAGERKDMGHYYHTVYTKIVEIV
jgi:hypothetical protein